MYNKKDFIIKLEKFIKIHLKNYDYVYLTSDIRGFLQTYRTLNANEICSILISLLLKKNITTIVPAFTYTGKGKFFLNKENSNLSFMTKWILKKKNTIRSEHPIFSVCAIGKNSKIVKNIGKSAFGLNSIFDRLLKKKSSLFHFGRPFSYGNTMIHFIEQKYSSSYRFHKIFKTKVYKNKKFIGSNYSAFVRKGKVHDKRFVSNTTKISKVIKKKNFFKQVGNEKNLTNITHLDLKKTYHSMCKAYQKNNRIFIN